jgi:tetratricopeptide (TPR) repeat protein
MARSDAGIALGLVILLGAAFENSALGQFGPLRNPEQGPQAKTEDELDAYLEIVAASGRDTRIEKVQSFSKSYPDSALLGVAYQYEMLAHAEQGNTNCVIEAGRKALPLLRDNLKTLLTLASAITNVATARPDAEPMLTEAEEYARRALARLVELQIPRELPLEEYERLRGEMESQAHEVLGQIAAKRGRWQDAVSEFRIAAESNPSPQGAQFFRLGAACAAVGRKECAAPAFRRAGQLGPEQIRLRVIEALRKVEGDGTEAPAVDH